MLLQYRVLGEGSPLFILHGLFGSSDNWQTLGKYFAEKHKVFLIDLRNHGHSPHSDEWNYEVMSNDLLEIMDLELLNKVSVLGHSMGGKVAMQLAFNHPEKINKLIVVDIAPRYYQPHHTEIIEALQEVKNANIKTRKEAETILTKYQFEQSTNQFLLKNLYWKTETKLDWRFNLDIIANNIEEVGKTFELKGNVCEIPTLFLRGDKSKYINKQDITLIHQLFTLVTVKTIANSGHWIHAENPKDFFVEVSSFLES